MVEDELDDGKRIAQLLASEITGHERPPLGRLSVENADPDAEPSLDGTFAYEVARDAGLRVRPKAVEPPRLLVFVESGAEVKRALPVLRALAAG